MCRRRNGLVVPAILTIILTAVLTASLALAEPSPGMDLCQNALDRSSFDEAIAVCTRLLDDKGLPAPDRTMALHNRGRARYGKGEVELAIQDQEQARAVRPDYAEVAPTASCAGSTRPCKTTTRPSRSSPMSPSSITTGA